MTFSDFISRYDFPGSIVLLEGKRVVQPDDVESLKTLGKLLAAQTQHIKFRSGNAPGSDAYFSEGVTEADIARLQIIKPYRSHRSTAAYTTDVVSLDEVDLTKEDKLVEASLVNERTEKIIRSYASGTRTRISMKAAYLIRDTMKVVGAEGLPPANFAIFYDDLSKPVSGGTGHTMQVCNQHKVPWIDQRIWMQWLSE
jgi:hypothetical protein